MAQPSAGLTKYYSILTYTKVVQRLGGKVIEAAAEEPCLVLAEARAAQWHPATTGCLVNKSSSCRGSR